MSDITKFYHWTNILLNPLLVLLIFATQSDFAIGIAMGWALLSAVLNEKFRSWVFGFFASLTAGSIIVGCLASAVGLFVLVAATAIVATVGFFAILPLLWVTSLKAVIDEQLNLI